MFLILLTPVATARLRVRLAVLVLLAPEVPNVKQRLHTDDRQSRYAVR